MDKTLDQSEKQQYYRSMWFLLDPLTSLKRTHELLPLTISLCLLIVCRLRYYRESYHYIFLENQDADILYLSTKFECDWFTNNGDLLSDRNH